MLTSVCATIYLLQCLTLTDSVVLPTVIWDPRKPMFACKDPTVHVKINDQLNFFCANNELHSYTGDINLATSMPYENMYFLMDDKDAFDSCNATGHRKLLHCSHDGTSPSVYNMIFRSFKTGPNTLAFTAGKTYYLIGTGNRSKEYLDNKVGGSCNTTQEGYAKLRLKIYVCTQEDFDTGKCDVCQSEGCYYKDCSTVCTDWLHDKLIKDNTNNHCSMLQKQNCSNHLFGSVTTKYRETPWPCDKQPTTDAGTNVRTAEFNSSPVEHTNDDDKIYKYLAIGLSIAFFLIGSFVGGLVYRWHHMKNCSKKIASVQSCSSMVTGLDNKNYRPSFYGDYDEPVYEPTSNIQQYY